MTTFNKHSLIDHLFSLQRYVAFNYPEYTLPMLNPNVMSISWMCQSYIKKLEKEFLKTFDPYKTISRITDSKTSAKEKTKAPSKKARHSVGAPTLSN